MSVRMRLITGLVAVLLAVACGQGGGASPTPSADAAEPAVIVDAPDAPVSVAAGQQFALRVEANAGVGYEWEVVEPGDSGVVVPDGFVYVDAGGDAPPGAGSLVDYQFTAVAPGTTTVVLRRSYRGEVEDPPVERRHDVTVTE